MTTVQHEVHICEVCFIQSTRHPQPEWVAGNDEYFIPPCCQGCGCGTYEQFKAEWNVRQTQGRGEMSQISVSDLCESIAEALCIGCEDGEYYIPAEPEPIIVGDSLVEAVKRFKHQTDKWAAEDEKKIAALEAQVEALQDKLLNMATREELAERRVEALQRENALLKDTNGIYFDFNKISDLIAENERLKAPVSDEESGFFWWRSGPDDLITSREGVNRLIASRATQPDPQGKS
jgi:hypothetical protein